MTRTFTERITGLFSVLNPIAFLVFKDTPIIILILPIIPFLIELIIDWLITTKDIKLTCQNLPSIKFNKQCNQNIYYKICWYISKECKTDNLLCTGVYGDNFNSYFARKLQEGKKIVPTYSIFEPFASQFTYKKNKIYVTIFNDTNKENYLSLYSDKIEILNDLVDYILNEYQKYIKSSDNNVYKFYTYSLDYRGETAWSSNPIFIMKNRENIFLQKSNELIFNSVSKFLDSKNLYERNGIPYKKGILLHGTPGSGKSSIVYAIAHEYNMSIYKISALNMIDDQFIAAIKSIPPKNILLIEDIDTIKSLHSRKNDLNEKIIENVQICLDFDKINPNKNNTINLETVLHALDGYIYLHECIIIFTSNDVSKLDEALLRPGRIDEKYLFTYADDYQIKNILDNYNCEDFNYKLTDGKITTADLIHQCLINCNS